MTQFEVVQKIIDEAKKVHNKKKENVSPKEYEILTAQFDILMNTVSIIQDAIDKEQWYDLNTVNK